MRWHARLATAVLLAAPLLTGCGDSSPAYVSVAVYQGPALTVQTSAGQTQVAKCGAPAVLKKPDGFNEPWRVSLRQGTFVLTTFAGDASPDPKRWARVVTTGGGSTPLLTYAYAVDHVLSAKEGGSTQPSSCG